MLHIYLPIIQGKIFFFFFGMMNEKATRIGLDQ